MDLKNLKLLEKPEQFIRWILVGIVFIIILNRAWISDDAYITLRTVDNFINGYGLTWNVNERVEVYTHPLWMLLLSFFYFFTHEAYLTTIFLSLALALFTLIYLQFKIKPLSHFILVFLVLSLSNAFVDFATSGLENVLSYALFALFFFQFFNKKDLKENYFKIVFLAGLIGLNRPDLLLLVFPLLIYVLFQQPNKGNAIIKGLLAISPLIAWEIFSYFYYGFMFPNTYYAKTNSGIPENQLLVQGLFYFFASILRDPITPTVIVFGIFFGFINRKWIIRLLSFGIFFYLIYIIKIGGDFMVGRFLTIPFLISVLILNTSIFTKLNFKMIILTSTLIILIGLSSPFPSFTKEYPLDQLKWISGVGDERAYYFQGVGLFRSNKFNKFPDLPIIQKGIDYQNLATKKENMVIIQKNVGFIGYYAGPNIYIVDKYAIGNAYFAHQPMNDFDNWRIGHFERNITADYLQSILAGENLIKNQELAKLYDEIIEKTQNKLLSSRRLKLLIKINL